MQSINVPIGAIDRKVDPHLMAPEDYLDAMNIRNHQGGAVPMRGNAQVSLSLPAGTNKFVGSVEDQLNRRTIFFVWNSNNNHCIVEYKNGVARILGQPSSAYEFASGRYIHSGKIIDGDLLFWTDALVLPSGTITGTAPKKLSTKRLDIVKNLTHTVNFTSAAFVTGNAITYQVVSLITGATIVASQTVYTVQPGDTQAQVVQGVRNGIAALGSQVTYVTGDLFIEVQHPGSGMNITMGGGASAIPTNYYRPNITAEEITVGRPFPKTPPYPYYEKATGVSGNRVQKAFQFRYRYQFSDGEYSAWGPVSYVPTNFRSELNIAIGGGFMSNDAAYNRIGIVINDPRLNDPNWRSLIKGIDIAYKNYDTGVWRFVQRDFKIRQVPLTQIDVKFLGVGEAAAVPSDEASAANTQALKNFDFVPRLALAHEFTYDKQGSVYGFWAGLLQGYDIPRVRATVAVVQKSDLSPTSPATQTSLGKTMKSGGRYKVGVVYENALHQSPVIPIGQVDIPFSQMFNPVGQNGYYLTVTIDSNPPSWATHYRIVITKNLNQSQYVQIPFTNISLWRINTQDNSAVLAGSETPTHVGFSASRKLIDEANDRNILFDLKEHTEKLFIPTRGDRIQIVSWNTNPNLIETNIQTYNHEIAGYSLTYPDVSDEDRFTVFINYFNGIPGYPLPATPGINYAVGEIYRQQEIESDLYYEFGDVYAITNGSHATNPVELITFGDAYSKNSRFYFSNPAGTLTSYSVSTIHTPELHPWEVQYQPDYGREQIEDPNYKETFEFDIIRATDTFISETEINGLSSFRGSNFIRLNKENGEIFKIVKVDSILLAICRNRSQPIYVNKSELMDLSGQTLVGRSNALLNIAEELNQELGTQNPTSIVTEDSTVYGWDAIRGTVWRYSVGAGQFPISYYKMAEYFNARTRRLQAAGLTEDVIGGYQREFGMYYINFKGASIPGTVIPYETWGFEEQRNGNQGNKWPSRFTMNPDIFATCLSEFFSATNALWKHESGYTQYGNGYPVYIQVVVNANSEIVKNFYRVTVEASSLWDIPTIVIPGTADYPAGMRSRLTPNKLSKYEGQWMGDFLRDETDPRYANLLEPERTVRALLQGRPLRGEVMYITLQLSSVSDSILRKIITTFEPSKIV